LNRISTTAPKTAADVLLDIVEVAYQPVIMSAMGEQAVQMAETVYTAGNYLLVVEGGIPTAFGGAPCFAWSMGGKDFTIQELVIKYAGRAAGIVCLGNCAAWGGMSAAAPNPTAVKGVKTVTGKTTINVPGCPAHPDWFIWVVANFLAKATITLDSYGRPKALFGRTVHDQCPRRETEEADRLGQPNQCLKELGCRGPETRANCPVVKWNGGVSWCVEANMMCIGCTEPSFPTVGIGGGKGEYEEEDD
jgi:NiFe hydrogenase small subunit HydA